MTKIDINETIIKAEQASLNVFSVGDPLSRPIILVHGLKDSAKSLLAVASRLAQKYHVVLPELRGHGRSQQFVSYSMPDFLGDLYKVIEQFTDGSCALFGHSLGGHISSKYAALFPEQIKSLILVEGLGPPSQDNLSELEEINAYRNNLLARQINAAKPAKQMPTIEDATKRLISNNPRLPENKAKKIAKFLTTNSEDALAWNFDPRANGVFIGTSYRENEKFWRHSKCPTCIVSGALSYEYWDKEMSAYNRPSHFQTGEMEARVAQFPDAEHHWFEMSGHMVHYDEPDRLASVCETFLEKKYE